MAKKIVILILIHIFNPLNAEEISGVPKIIDGDTIYINDKKIRLEGIDAPETKQKCKKPYLKISTIINFTFNEEYSCGVLAKEELSKKIDNTEINCISSSKDRYKRYLGTCYKGTENINKWMVNQGYAVAYKKYSKQYLTDENYAKENNLGIWQGPFLRPEKWRKLN